MAITDRLSGALGSSYPFPGYNFCVVIDSVKLGFKSVSGLTLKKYSYTPFHEGGENFEISIHREERKDPNRLVLSKGLGSYNPSKKISKINVLLLLVLDEHHLPLHAYYFTKPFVEQVTVSDFDAQEARAIIDTTTILYDSACEVDLSGKLGYGSYLKQIAAAAASLLSDSGADAVKRIREHNQKVKEDRQNKASAGGSAIER